MICTMESEMSFPNQWQQSAAPISNMYAATAGSHKRGRDDDGEYGSEHNGGPSSISSSLPLQQQQQRANVLRRPMRYATPPTGLTTTTTTTAVGVAPTPPQPTNVAAPAAAQKRSRASTYEAPRTIRSTLLTAMGSLVGGGQAGDNSNTTVPARRRLSGGHLEEFIGGHDTMDMDISESRPRSMSL